jgi:two-component sensor histidine kinase
MLREWQLESMSDPALLLVSELVTNAVKASASQPGKDQSLPMIGLTLQFTDAGLLAEVWDANPAFPVLQQAELMEPGGLELVLVDALADAWGHRAADSGKVVWFTIAPCSVT